MFDFKDAERAARMHARRERQRLPPSIRVSMALDRMSRERWLSPEECQDLCIRFARCCSRSPAHTVGHVYNGEMTAVGLLRGRPPANLLDADYHKFLARLYKRKRKNVRDLSPEIEILTLLSKRGVTNGR